MSAAPAAGTVHITYRVPAGGPLSVLLAKGIDEAISDVQSESRGHHEEKGTGMPGTPTAQAAIRLMKEAASDAERQGDRAKADGLRRDVALLKLQIAERQRQERPTPSRLGPGAVELFKNTGSLPEDSALRGI
jgi:hypothetical protein